MASDAASTIVDNEANAVIFRELKFRPPTVKNCIYRSSISGRFDTDDGSRTYVRIKWEEKFAGVQGRR